MVPYSRRQVLRRGTLAGVIGMAGCLGGGCSEGRTVHNADISLSQSARWPTFQHDPANTGYNPDATGPSGEATTAWRYSRCTENEAGVVVDSGTVSTGPLLLAADTGKSRTTVAEGGGTPAVANDTLYLTGDALHAYDPSTGGSRWTYPAGGSDLPAPKVGGGTVYVSGGRGDPTVYAVAADTGAERWQFGTDAEVSVPVAVQQDEESAYVVDDKRGLYALSTASGDARWTVDLSGSRPGNPSVPVVAGGRVYVPVGDGRRELGAVRTTDGSVVWRRDVGYRIKDPVAVAEGTVYAAGRHDDEGAVLGALDAATGRTVWTTAMDRFELGPPAVAGDAVYVGSQFGEHAGALYARDRATGEGRWSLEFRGVEFGDYTAAGIVGSPAVVDECVVLATAGGDVYAVSGG